MTTPKDSQGDVGNQDQEHDHDDSMLASSTVTRAKDLLHCMEVGDVLGASEAIRELSRVREDSLFYQLGKLTRELHEALKSFQMDSELAGYVEVDLPDARARLNYVISKTEDAANRTMDNIENTIPISDNLAKEATYLKGEWGRFKRREMTLEEFKDLYGDMMEFLNTTETKASTIHSNLNDVLLAQDFQDLTGQIIRRVINLVTEVEDNLVHLVKLASEVERFGNQHDPAHKMPDPKIDITAEGPRIDGENSKVSGQDEVDDLLSSLGF